jgi:2-methylcitrate dehydratase PrpD
MAIKLMPGGHPYHALAEAAAAAAAAADIAPEAVASITVSRPSFTALTGPLHPTDLVEMAHSPAYFLAAAVADRSFSWIHASSAKIGDPLIHRLIDKVRVGDPPTGDAGRYRLGATVTVRAIDGRAGTRTILAPKGAAASGLVWADVDAKYRALVPKARVSEAQVEASLAVIHDLRDVSRVSALIDLLRV